jgi:hypothetical protein
MLGFRCLTEQFAAVKDLLVVAGDTAMAGLMGSTSTATSWLMLE